MLDNLNIGLGITGSFCNFPKIQKLIQSLKEENVNKIIPIVSQTSLKYNTRFYNRRNFKQMIEDETGNKIVSNIVDAEPIGHKNMIDVLVIVPCTGKTIAKL